MENPVEDQQISAKELKPQIMHKGLMVVLAFIFGALLNLITYKQGWGLQWPIGVASALGLSVILSFAEHRRIPWQTWLMMAITLCVSLIPAFRTEIFTQTAAILFSIQGLTLVFASFLNGQGLLYRVRELIVEGVRLWLSGAAGFFRPLFSPRVTVQQSPSAGTRLHIKRIGRILLGVVLALPILLVFGAFFSSADPIFAERLRKLTQLPNLENLKTYLVQVVNIVIFAYFAFGALYHAYTRGASRRSLDPDLPIFQPFIGFTEGAVILTLVNLLFAAFLLVQFEYFFAGKANINLEGFTYAEYARQGFFELTVVALVAGFLHWAMQAVIRRDTRQKSILFSVLITVLLVQVAVILVAAFNRMQLYIQAYGLSSQRIVTSVFMLCIGLVLIALLVMQWTNRFNRFALILSTAFLIFAIALGTINIEKQVVAYSLNHPEILDGAYLAELGTDSTPALFQAFNNTSLPADMHDELGKILRCQQARLSRSLKKDASRISVGFSEREAEKLFTCYTEVLESYKMVELRGGQGFVFNSGEVQCTVSDFD